MRWWMPPTSPSPIWAPCTWAAAIGADDSPAADRIIIIEFPQFNKIFHTKSIQTQQAQKTNTKYGRCTLDRLFRLFTIIHSCYTIIRSGSSSACETARGGVFLSTAHCSLYVDIYFQKLSASSRKRYIFHFALLKPG